MYYIVFALHFNTKPYGGMLPLPNHVHLFLIAELAIVYTDVKNNMKIFFQLEIHDVQSTEGAVKMIVQSVHLEGTTPVCVQDPYTGNAVFQVG